MVWPTLINRRTETTISRKIVNCNHMRKATAGSERSRNPFDARPGASVHVGRVTTERGKPPPPPPPTPPGAVFVFFGSFGGVVRGGRRRGRRPGRVFSGFVAFRCCFRNALSFVS